MRSFLRNNSAFVLLTIASVASVIRFSWFIQTHSVNLLYTDQWALYEIFLRHPNLWELFTFQYGPHRQGIGYIITWLVAVLSGWNVRVEILTLTITHIGTLFFLLALKHKLFNKWHISDLIIPILLFSLKYFEAFTIVPNISHGVLPILLISLMALVWTTAAWQKYIVFASVGILTIYTGFGIVVLPAIFVLLFSKFKSPLTGARAKNNILVAGAIALAGTVSYFYGYAYNPAVNCSINPLVDWVNYPPFIGKLTINFFAYSSTHTPVLEFFGLGIFAFTVCVFAINIGGLFRQNSHPQPIAHVQFLFLETTLIFILLCSLGRACVGIEMAGSSRYLLYFIPAAVAGYFMILQLKSHLIKMLLAVTLIGVFLIGEVISMPNITKETLYIEQGKNLWLSCYRTHQSISYCDEDTNFKIFPPILNDVAEEILMYTRNYGLYIYKHL